MKKSIIILALFMTSCVSDNNPTEPERIIVNNVNYKVYEIEGCEYIVMGYGDSKWGSHKGNCKNPLHITR